MLSAISSPFIFLIFFLSVILSVNCYPLCKVYKKFQNAYEILYGNTNKNTNTIPSAFLIILFSYDLQLQQLDSL